MSGDGSQNFSCVPEYVEGAAYHEASHIVVAAVQGLPLGKAGLRIYETGAGFAHYSGKQPDGSTNVGADPCRERTIIATLAGHIAHGTFYPRVAGGDANASDILTVYAHCWMRCTRQTLISIGNKRPRSTNLSGRFS